jgi:uncharacterized phage protein (TIGR01671 family)
MREIKFRAWHTEAEVFHYQELINFGSFNYMPTMPDSRAFDKTLLSPIYSELMQYTGLKDKNGKEIYEGDIVDFVFKISKGDVHKRANHTRGAVEWSKNNTAFGIKDGNYYEMLNGIVSIEVIGNIYANPELLK